MIRRFASFVLPALLLVACQSDRGSVIDPLMPALPAAPTRPPSLSPQAVAAPVWQAVLAAGDGELTTTDTAVIELRERLLDADISEARIRVLSANPSRYLSDVYIQMPREALTDAGRVGTRPGRARRATAPCLPRLPGFDARVGWAETAR